jgi:hypothetical protein
MNDQRPFRSWKWQTPCRPRGGRKPLVSKHLVQSSISRSGAGVAHARQRVAPVSHFLPFFIASQLLRQMGSTLSLLNRCRLLTTSLGQNRDKTLAGVMSGFAGARVSDCRSET